jgi:hypothetical protein
MRIASKSKREIIAYLFSQLHKEFFIILVKMWVCLLHLIDIESCFILKIICVCVSLSFFRRGEKFTWCIYTYESTLNRVWISFYSCCFCSSFSVFTVCCIDVTVQSVNERCSLVFHCHSAATIGIWKKKKRKNLP